MDAFQDTALGPNFSPLEGDYVLSKGKVFGPDDEIPCDIMIDTTGPTDLESGMKFVIDRADTLTQRQLKSHPNKWVRKANRIHKRDRDAAFADEVSRRRDQSLKAFLDIIEPEVEKLDAEGKLTRKREFVLRRLRALQFDVSNSQPLYVLRAEKHDPEKGSRAIRRKVSHDWRKGSKPGPAGHGSVKLTALDLVETHGHPAAAVLGTEAYNAALAEAHAQGDLLRLRPLPVKGEAEPAGERAAA